MALLTIRAGTTIRRMGRPAPPFEQLGLTVDDPNVIAECRRAFDGQAPRTGAETNPWVKEPPWEQMLEQLNVARPLARDVR